MDLIFSKPVKKQLILKSQFVRAFKTKRFYRADNNL